MFKYHQKEDMQYKNIISRRTCKINIPSVGGHVLLQYHPQDDI